MQPKFRYPPYFVLKIDEKYIIITEYGSFIVLDKNEYKKFRFPDEKLFEKLEKKGIIITQKNINEIKEKYKKRFLFFKTPKIHSIVIDHEEEITKEIIENVINIINFILKFPGEKEIKIFGKIEEVKNILKEKKIRVIFSEKQEKFPKFITNSCDNICKGIISFLAYDIKGNIYPCENAVGFEIFKIGNVFEKHPFFEKSVLAFLTFSIFNPLCISCPFQAFCTPCPVEIYKKYKRLGIIDKDKCKKTREIFFKTILK